MVAMQSLIQIARWCDERTRFDHGLLLVQIPHSTHQVPSFQPPRPDIGRGIRGPGGSGCAPPIGPRAQSVFPSGRIPAAVRAGDGMASGRPAAKLALDTIRAHLNDLSGAEWA